MNFRSRHPRTGTIPGPLFLLVILAVVLSGCGGPPGPKPLAPETVSGLRFATLRMESVPDEVESPGTVQSVATAQVAARAMGSVAQVAVREGDFVKRGQLLVLLDEREFLARRNAARAALDEAAAAREEAAHGLAAAQAQADVASKTYERFDYLRQQKSVSPQEFDEVEAKHRVMQAGLEAAQARKQQVEAMHARAESEARAAETVAGYARVVAPFDGVVVRRMIEPGSLATPGTPLLIVEDTSRYRLEATIDASTAAARGVKRGTRVRVTLDALPDKEFEGAVAELEAGADPMSHTVRARVELPRDPGLRSGLFGRALLCCGERRAIVVPQAAVLHRGQLHAVYVVDADQLARLRLVTIGRASQGRVEILSGLGEGERIVLNPENRELDSKRVEAER